MPAAKFSEGVRNAHACFPSVGDAVADGKVFRHDQRHVEVGDCMSLFREQAPAGRSGEGRVGPVDAEREIERYRSVVDAREASVGKGDTRR